jgi:hypothetical protein
VGGAAASGKRDVVYFLSANGGDNVHAPPYRFERINLDGTDETTLFEVPAHGWWFDFSLTADERRVIFVAANADGTSSAQSATLEGTNLQTLTPTMFGLTHPRMH